MRVFVFIAPAKITEGERFVYVTICICISTLKKE